MIAGFGPTLGPSCWKDFSQKRLTEEKADSINQRIAAKWDNICAAIVAISLHAEMLAVILKEADAPRTP
ncbi:hypothetical protein [Dongia deserti]|uniref:hypothetical protein n=1 Tax=Dongia deserti TaxID=2268030 RepID=UPI000E6515AA|nr:hypothetical protein [Dongia deserti]